MAMLTKRHTGALDVGDWMDRLFEDRLLPGFMLRDAFLGKDSVRIEEFAEDDALVIRAEMPGIDPDKDVEISMHDGMLHIRAERRESSEHKDKAGYRSEFTYGMFERALPLPAGVSETDVTATYKDGILEVRVPMTKGTTETAKINVVRMP
jgi:HSP20 family protein